jgi:WD40 repeat protein
MSIMVVLSSYYELELLGHADTVCAIIQLTDGRLCTGSDDNTIKLWNLASGECESTLVGHSRSVSAIVQYSSTHICSGSYDNTIKLWNLQTSEYEKTIQVGGYIQSLELLPNGNIAVSPLKVSMQIWNVQSEQCIRTFGTYVREMIQLASGDLCSCTRTGLLSIWDYLTGQELKSFQLRPELNIIQVFTLLLLKDGRVCISCDREEPDDNTEYTGCILIYDLETEECEQVIREGQDSMQYITELSDGRLCYFEEDCALLR